jgi:hypothetical protein
MHSQNLFPLGRSTCRNFFDSPLLTVSGAGNIVCREANQQTRFQKDFCQPVQRFRETPPQPCAASSPADAQFRLACSPEARSWQSACSRVRPAVPDRSPHRGRKSPHLQRFPRDTRSHPEKLPPQQRRQSPHFHRQPLIPSQHAESPLSIQP